MYMSLSAEPGYDTDLLSNQFGFDGPLRLFDGKPKSYNGTTIMQWGNDTHHIKGDIFSKQLKVYQSIQDIWTQSRRKVENKLYGAHINSYVVSDGGKKLWKKMEIREKFMRKIMIPMKPIFPSDKITYNIEGMRGMLDGKFGNVMFFFNENRTFDIELFLEDSKRYFLWLFT